MNRIDDLRRTLREQAAAAGDGSGMVERARAGAARIRRRRRVAAVCVAGAMVAATAVTVPFLVTHHSGATPSMTSTTTPPSPAAFRLAQQMTVTLDPGAGFQVRRRTVYPDRQYLSGARPAHDNEPFEVLVLDPHAADATDLRNGERRRVGDHDAWYLPRYPRSLVERPEVPGETDETLPVMTWADPSGAWVVAYPEDGSATRTDVERFAAAVRAQPPADLRVPFRLGWFPPAVGVLHTTTGTTPRTWATVALADRPQPRRPYGFDLSVTVRSTTGTVRGDGEAMTIGGRRAWYQAEGSGGSTGRLVMDAGSCTVVIVTADRGRITREDIVRVAATMTVAACDDETTWMAATP